MTKEGICLGAEDVAAEEVVGGDVDRVDDAGLNNDGVRLYCGQSLQLGDAKRESSGMGEMTGVVLEQRRGDLWRELEESG